MLADEFSPETMTFRRNPRDDVIDLFLVTENKQEEAISRKKWRPRFGN